MERIADYSVVRMLGEGSHGRFYLVVPPERVRSWIPSGCEYLALKVMAGPTSEDAYRRFSRELTAFAAVRSPYLVPLFDAGQEGRSYFYATEYFPLGSLASPARQVGRDKILRAVAHASRAAHALHEAGIIHRDIKPANVMLHDEGAKLSDLGMAHVLRPGIAVTSMGPVSSVEFVDPLTMLGPVSVASDIWSLGATLHWALTGTGIHGPFPERDTVLAVSRLLNSVPHLDPALEPGERAVIESCLRPEPDERPHTAQELADRIEALPTASGG